MKKDADSCFLCARPGKGKRFTFYSGVMKGGTSHKMLSCTVTFFERWNDLTMYDVQVCRECQVRLWRRKHFFPMVACAVGAVLTGSVVPAALLLLTGTARFVAGGVAAVPALLLAILFVVYLRRYFTRKPKYDAVEPLVIQEAMTKLPNRGHTYMTRDQYLDRHDRGIIG